MSDGKRKIIANVPRLNDFMDRHGCSAIVARSGTNITYLSGVAFPGSQGRHVDFPDSPREIYVVWPRQGEPVMVLNNLGIARAWRDSWIPNIEGYDDYRTTAFARTAEVIERLGLTKSKIGFEKTYLSASHWEEFHRLLPDVEMFDCTELMDAVRWVKTPGEVDLLRRAADIQDDAYVEVFSNVGEGYTLREVHAQLVKACMARGAEIVHGLLNTSRNNVRYLGEGDTLLEKGDIVRTDYVSYLQGYPSHQSRVFVVGPPSEEQVEMYRKYREVHLMTIDRCRPGVRANDLFSFADQKLKEYGFSGAGSMVGHSVGPWFHQQQPLLVADCHTQIEEGMVVAVEPFSSYWHLQDMILVTGGEPELLTGKFDTERLFVID